MNTGPSTTDLPVEPDAELQQLQQRLVAEKKKLAMVRELSLAFSTNMSLHDLLDATVTHITALMEADRTTVYLIDDSGQSLSPQVAQDENPTDFQLVLGEGIAGSVALTGQAVNTPNAYEHPSFEPAFDQKSGYKTQSMLCVPMLNLREEIIGVVQVLNKKEGKFNKGDESLLKALAGQAAVAIENTKLYESLLFQNEELSFTQHELEQRNVEINVLYEIERDITAAGDLDELLDVLLLRATQAVGAQAGSIALRSRKKGDLRFHTTMGARGEEVRRYRLPMGQGIIGWVAAHGEPAMVNDPANDARHNREFAESIGVLPQNILCAPLHIGEQTVGAIALFDKAEGQDFTEGDLRLLELIAGQAARAIQQTRAKLDADQENRLATIGQMMAGVMHDFKTPMAAVSWYAELMNQTEDPKERAQYVERISRQFELMNAMSGEVLAFARGETNLLARKVNLSRFLEETGLLVRHQLAGRDIEFEIDAHYNGPAYFDETKMMRVVHNLARNAAQAMPEGGTFTLSTSLEDNHLVFEFKDTGQGIPTEIKDNLYEPFTTAGKKNGTGLGLAIVKKIVDQHDGDISCCSTPDKGTSFLIKIPQKEV